ncbi:ABC transporter permease [Staphylococcus argensis]|uniref:Transport permease protein n=1 Tax=Staphylococcus argensis TaxID=1607738 RepID=A0A2K4FEC2_9STAP|nr:ABC transporter permease [Staphylococcus argensis]MCY6991142.1 ABC transporter permease [Staphylococcus argensis]POA09661.1 ABC transporter permease [Staphylococcus argensis]
MILTYLGVEIKMLFRKKVYLALSILLPLVFYLLFTAIIDIPTAQQNTFYKEYMYSMVTFSLTSFCLMSFPLDLIEEQQIGWQKQLLNTRMSYFTYYMTKVLKTMIQFALSIIVIFIVAATVRDVSMAMNEWVISGLTLWICASLFLSIGVLIAQVNDLQKASSLGNILYIVLAMVGGLWFPVSQFPEWLKVIAYKSPTYHMKQIALDIGKGEHFNWQSMLVLITYSIIFVVIALLLKRKRGASQ